MGCVAGQHYGVNGKPDIPLTSSEECIDVTERHQSYLLQNLIQESRIDQFFIRRLPPARRQ
jgi:hypothetical protein